MDMRQLQIARLMYITIITCGSVPLSIPRTDQPPTIGKLVPPNPILQPIQSGE